MLFYSAEEDALGSEQDPFPGQSRVLNGIENAHENGHLPFFVFFSEGMLHVKQHEYSLYIYVGIFCYVFCWVEFSTVICKWLCMFYNHEVYVYITQIIIHVIPECIDQ